MPENFCYGVDKLTITKAISLASGKQNGILSESAIEKIKSSQQHVQEIVDNNKTVYGINTGFGILANTKISEQDTATLQHKILQSHSVGVGDPVPADVAKIMLITKVHALAQGFSGVRLQTLERILWHIENGAIPIVPEKGSVGASGDLAPLAHLFLPLIGLGEVTYQGRTYKAQQLLDKFSLSPVDLGPKEGLALINGTQSIVWFQLATLRRLTRRCSVRRASSLYL